MKKAGSAADPLWYKDAIFYELHVRAFADSNGDGIGDFPGLIGKLDYLQQLGITCIWLLPFFPSPLLDDGYDVADYTGVHPSYGTLSDFKRFLDAAHQRGMQVLIELVMNHTSNLHPWFQRARLSPPGSKERDFYVWDDANTRFSETRIIFKDTETSNWTWDPVAKAYFWHRFFSHQPDLNYDNPVVLEEMLDAMRFWLDMGVDGLRLDAIPYLVERDDTSCENLPETHVIIRQVRAAIDAEYGNRLVLAEANQWPSDVRPYFGDGDECHMAFHFPLMPRMYVALRQEDSTPIVEIMRQTPEIPSTCQWGLFLRNHDELTLEMVTEDERDYMYLAYSADPRMRLNLGIRRRLAPLLDNSRPRIELLNSLLFSFPGTPILYYGDEIGMGDNLDLGDRNGVRTPMQWNGERNAGFSTAPADLLYSPVIADPVYGYLAVNAEEQLENPSSTLQWTRNMIGLRKLFVVFGRGSLRFLDPQNRKVLAYLRQLDGETVLCVANLSRFAQPATLDLGEFDGQTPIEMFGYTAFSKIAGSPYGLTLSPYAFLWFQLQPASRVEAAESDAIVPEIGNAAAIAGIALEKTDRAGEVVQTVVYSSDAARVLIHLPSGGGAEVRKLAAISESLVRRNGNLSVTLAFPLPSQNHGGSEALDWPETIASSMSATSPAIVFAPYAEPATAVPQRWLHPARTYVELGSLADKHKADVVVLLGQDAASLNAAGIPGLVEAVLGNKVDLAVPLYQASRYDGLLNIAVVHPITKALYGANIRYPLAADMAFSGRFCAHLAAAGSRFDSMAQDDSLIWPVTEAAVNGFVMVQVSGISRNFIQPEGVGLAQTLSHIFGELFAEAERRAARWQKGNPLSPLPTLIAERIDDSPSRDLDHATVAAEMYDSFHLAAGPLREIWTRTLAPGTQLRLKRLVEMPRDRFAMPDTLWVNIVYDFLVSYHSHTVNRMHLFGALVPLYLGWGASYVSTVAALTEEQAELRITALADAFETEKPYLMSRWRWPDRFAP